MGREIALKFGTAGYRLCLMTRDGKTTEPIATEAREAGAPEVRSIAMDVTDEPSVVRAFETVRQSMGVPSVMIYNVATMVKTPPSGVTPKEIVDTLPAMFFGAMHCTRAVLPDMRSAGKGTLLFTGGGFGIKPATFAASHSIGKAALRNWVQNLHQELAPAGILAATVTITRPVKAGTEYDGGVIAGHYLDLHQQTTSTPADQWEWEIIHREL